MSDNPSAFHRLLAKWGVTPVQAAVAGASLGFFLVCAGFALPFSQFGIDPVTKDLKLGGSLDNWRKNAGFLLLVAACVFAGLALMFASLQLARDEERKSQGVRRFVYGFNAFLGTVLVVIVLGVVNVLAFADPIDQLTGRALSRDFDWTKGTMYTLQARTVSYLDGLQEPVKVYSFLETGDPGYTEMTSLLRGAQARNKKFTWERLTLTPRPDAKVFDLIKKYTLKDPQGGVLLIAGDEAGKHDHEFIAGDKIARQDVDFRTGRRSNKVLFTGENALLGALTTLLEGQVVVYFTQGHGEPSLDGPAGGGRAPGADGGLSALKGKLTANRRRFEVKPLTFDRGTTKVPEDATAVVIVRPTEAFADQETKLLGEYLARKGETNPDKTVKVAAGRLMVLLDPLRQKGAGGAAFTPTGLEAFLAGYGVQLPGERIQTALGNDPMRITTIINPRGKNPLNAAFNDESGVTAFTLDGVRVVKPAEKAAGPYEAEMLLAAVSQGMWLETDLGSNPDSRAEAIRNDAELYNKLRARGAVSAAVAVSASGAPPKRPGMPDDPAHGGGASRPLMAVFGSAGWVTDQGLTGPTGALRLDLFASTLSWLREQTDLGKFVDDKSAEEYELRVP
ncbi:MAG: Gldg family protein, partial [Gemmataceae bacterium]